MEKYQLYRTALDALQFLVSSDLEFKDTDKNILCYLATQVCDSLKKVLSDKIDL